MLKTVKAYEEGRQHLENAVTADEGHNYSLAMNEYQKSCECYVAGLRNDNNPKRRKETIAHVQAYLARAEKIKQKIGTSKSIKLKHGGLDQVAGLDYVKGALKEAILLPMLQPQLFSGKRKAWKGVLLFGPPGTGKSFIVEKMSEDVDVNFISLSAADIMSKWQGESEQSVRKFFNEAREKIKKTGKSCIIFIDEIDSIGRKRDLDEGSNNESHKRVLTELLRQMDGLNTTQFKGDGDIIVIGATNHAEDLDFALRRRFEKRIYIPLPGIKTRLALLKKTFNEKPESKVLHNLNLKNLIDVARLTTGYSSADLSIIVNESLMLPVRRCLQSQFFKPVFKDEKKGLSFMSQIRKIVKFNDPIGQLEASGRNYTLIPCAKNDPGAIKVSMLDDNFPSQRLELPKVEFEHLKAAAEKLRPSVSSEEIERHEKFAINFSGDRNRELKDAENLTDNQLGYIDPEELLKMRRSMEVRMKNDRKNFIKNHRHQPVFVLNDDLPDAPNHRPNQATKAGVGEKRKPVAF